MFALFRIRGFAAYLIAAFLNAFTDVGHKITIQNAIFKHYDGTTQIVLTAIVNAFILLPFVVTFSPAGFLSDKFPKDLILKISAATTIPLTALITLCYFAGWFEAAFFLTLALGVQSAFYGPAKYGYIKELMGKDNLAMSNAWVQAITIIAILSATFSFSFFFELMFDAESKTVGDILRTMTPLGIAMIVCSSLETLMVLRLPRKTETDAAMIFDFKKYASFGYLRENLSIVRRNDAIWLSIVGLAVFWAVNQVVLATFPTYLKDALHVNSAIVSNGLMTIGGIGVIVGSLIAGQLSKNYIETGIVPLGAIGVSALLFILPTTTSVEAMPILFFIYGIAGGFFIVPLNSLIQFHAGKHDLGKVLAANSFIQNLLMLMFLVITAALASLNYAKALPFEVTSSMIFWAMFVIAAAGSLFAVSKLPQSFVRYIVAFLVSQRYKLEVRGFNNIPSTGGALLLGNHSSYFDWAMLQIACPRNIRFVMNRQMYSKWYLRKILDFFGVIPISGAASSEAIRAIQSYLKQGEVVALFPEGRVSRNGQLAEFHRGFELAVKGTDVPIVPFYLRGLWGTAFSFATKRYKRFSASFTRHITVSFGKPLPTDSDAATVKQAVLNLSIDAWKAYSETLEPVHLSWLRTAKKLRGETAIVDFTGIELSHAKTLVAAIAFSKRIAALTKGEQNVGLILPPSSGCAIANLACLMTGKTVVNLNYTASKEALAHALKAANIKTVFTSEQFLSKLSARGIQLDDVLGEATVHHLEKLRHDIPKLELLWTAMQATLFPAWLLRLLYFKSPKLDDTAAILFSSGSEGLPKGVELTHRNIIGNIKQIASVLNAEENDVVLSSLPTFHAFGLTVTTFMPLVEGLKMVCQPDPTDALAVGKQACQHKVTLLFGTSTFLGLYARNPKLHPLMFESIRLVVAGAEKLNEQVRAAFKEKFNLKIYEGYGTTETTPVASVNVPDVLATSDWVVQVGNKNGTVGLPLPGSAFKIVDPETMEPLPIGEAGLILIGGTQVMKGYLNDPKKTADAIVTIDGVRWYKTGDKGKLDADGFLTILDRYSRFAKIGGEMISLSSVEAAARQALPDKEIELVAVNLPDANKGEKIILLVANATLDETAIKQSLTNAGINPLMIPKAIFKIDATPKLGSGKTDFGSAKKLAMELAAKETVMQ